MPGPMPKDPTVRQRRNKSSSHALLPAETFHRLRAPRLPELKTTDKDGNIHIEEWHPMARDFWHVVWSSPMSSEFLRGDEPALLRLVFLVHSFWKTGALDVAREIRMMEREFGLTPLSRRRLEWTVAQAEEAKDRHEQKRIHRGVVLDVDPRGVLDS